MKGFHCGSSTPSDSGHKWAAQNEAVNHITYKAYSRLFYETPITALCLKFRDIFEKNSVDILDLMQLRTLKKKNGSQTSLPYAHKKVPFRPPHFPWIFPKIVRGNLDTNQFQCLEMSVFLLAKTLPRRY